MKKNIGGLALVSPAMLLLFLTLLFPLFYTIYISVHEFNYLKPGNFIWLNNYAKLLNVEIAQSMIRTIILSIVGVAISTVFGLLLALWVNTRGGLYGYILQILILIPWVTSMIVSALLWRWILQNDLGLLNFILRYVGLEPVNFFRTGNIAMATLIFVISWRSIGYAMIMILAGLKGISPEFIEAGMIDGANKWQLLRYLKLPMIKTPLLVSSIVIMLSNFNNVTVPMALTGGGPAGGTNVVSLELYTQGFSYFAFGLASALSFIILIINIIMIIVYLRVAKYEI